MRKNRVFFLIEEYRRVQERLNDARAEHIRLQAILEIFKKLENEIADEIKKAKDADNAALLEQWNDIAAQLLPKDKDRPTDEAVAKAQKSFQENQRLIVYYEKKMLVIRSLLGARQIEILDGYEEKNLMMGDSASSASRNGNFEEEDKPKQDGDAFFFGKM